MRTPTEAKLRATKLRYILSELGYRIKHSESLETLSKLEGFADWNTYSARLSGVNNLLPVPHNWIASGESLNSYELGCDLIEKHNGLPVAVIRSREELKTVTDSMATLMQVVDAKEYIGSRVRLSAKIRAISVDGAVTIWLRIDGDAGSHNMLAFDNLEKHTKYGVLQGSTGWQERTIVLDVPESAASLNFGFYLRGIGVGHAADFSLERVGNEIPVSTHNETASAKPVNLDFKQN